MPLETTGGRNGRPPHLPQEDRWQIGREIAAALEEAKRLSAEKKLSRGKAYARRKRQEAERKAREAWPGLWRVTDAGLKKLIADMPIHPERYSDAYRSAIRAERRRRRVQRLDELDQHELDQAGPRPAAGLRKTQRVVSARYPRRVANGIARAIMAEKAAKHGITPRYARRCLDEWRALRANPSVNDESSPLVATEA
jgi:hypothetical protein